MAVVPLLHEACGTELEISEQSCAILAAGHQAAVVEALVVFDSDHQPAIVGRPLDLPRLAVAQHQRLDAQTC